MKHKLLLLTSLIIFSVVGRQIYTSGRDNQDVLPASTTSTVQANNVDVTQNEDDILAKPYELIIPDLNVSAFVEEVGTDGDGRMTVPTDESDVSWWKYGARPGNIGNAVLAGHFDTKSGNPGVFYGLKDLEKGDEIIVRHENGEELVFVVDRSEVYLDSEFPLDLVFGGSNGKNLNLITCDGVWDSEVNNYSNRLVVFSTLKV